MRGCTDLLRRRVDAGDPLIFGCVQDARSGAAVEAYHAAGFDVLLIDREHTSLGLETVAEHIRLARALGMPAMVRAADHSYPEIARVLDQGADGVFVPRVRNRAEVEDIVAASRYPPLGRRGLGASTCPASRYLGWSTPQEQVDYGNRDVVVGIQVETGEALEDIEDIVSVPGIDMAVVGNDDLSLGMGILGQLDSPQYLEAVERVIAACRRHGVMPGIAGADPVFVRYWAGRGMRAFWAASDVMFVWEGARARARTVRQALEGVS